MHLHRTPTHCPTCDPWPDWARHITAQLTRLEHLIMSEQAHLDQDVQAIAASVATIVTELKAQSAAGVPLDFSAADALVQSVQGEATADAPPEAPPAG
jgi:hypothetical protein